MTRTSRISGFFNLTLSERRDRLAEKCDLDADALAALEGGLALDRADALIENVVGTFSLPMAIATNFRINGCDYLVPMVVEEPSVVAAASHAAKLVRDHGGFCADVDPPEMIAQVQLIGIADPE